jgi:hypothetical protein
MRQVFPALPALWSALLALAFLLLGATVHADARTSYLIEQLKTNDDYRVRTQAALALGASGDDAAVAPLCDALGDSNVSVKVAAAAALGKLDKPAGLPCLQAAEPKESAQAAKAQIQKSIASLQGSSSSAPAPAPGPGTKFYVAIQVTNKTARPTPEVEALVRAAMQARLLAKSGYAVAPKAETPAQGGQIVKSKKLKGFLLIAAVEAPQYDGQNLSQLVRVSMWTYPDKALQGEFSPKLTQNGTSKGDTDSENLLVRMCVESAVETFQKVTASM